MARTTYQSEGNFQTPFTSVQGSQVPSGAFGGLTGGLSDLAQGVRGLAQGLGQASEISQRQRAEETRIAEQHKAEELRKNQMIVDEEIATSLEKARSAAAQANEAYRADPAAMVNPTDTESHLFTKTSTEVLKGSQRYQAAVKYLSGSSDPEVQTYAERRFASAAEPLQLAAILSERDRVHDWAKATELDRVATTLSMAYTPEDLLSQSTQLAHDRQTGWANNPLIRASDKLILKNEQQTAAYHQLMFLHANGHAVTPTFINQLQEKQYLSSAQAASAIAQVTERGEITLTPLTEVTNAALTGLDSSSERMDAADRVVAAVAQQGTPLQKEQVAGLQQSLVASSKIKNLTVGILPAGLSPDVTVTRLIGEYLQAPDQEKLDVASAFLGAPMDKLDHTLKQAQQAQLQAVAGELRASIADGTWVTRDAALSKASSDMMKAIGEGRFSPDMAAKYKQLVSEQAKVWGADADAAPKVPAGVLRHCMSLFTQANAEVDQFNDVAGMVAPEFPDIYQSVGAALSASANPHARKYAPALALAGTAQTKEQATTLLAAAKEAILATEKATYHPSQLEVGVALSTITDTGSVSLRSALEQGKLATDPGTQQTASFFIAAMKQQALSEGRHFDEAAVTELLVNIAVHRGTAQSPGDPANPRVLESGMREAVAMLFNGMGVVSLTGEQANPNTIRTALRLMPVEYNQKPTMFGAELTAIPKVEGRGEFLTAASTVAASIFDYQPGASMGTLPGEKLEPLDIAKAHFTPGNWRLWAKLGGPITMAASAFDYAKMQASGQTVGTDVTRIQRGIGELFSMPLGVQGVRSIGNRKAVEFADDLLDHSTFIFASELERVNREGERNPTAMAEGLDKFYPKTLSVIRDYKTNGMNAAGYVASILKSHGALVPAPDKSGDMVMVLTSSSGTADSGSSTGASTSVQPVYRYDAKLKKPVQVRIPKGRWQAMLSISNYDNSLQGWYDNRKQLINATGIMPLPIPFAPFPFPVADPRTTWNRLTR